MNAISKAQYLEMQEMVLYGVVLSKTADSQGQGLLTNDVNRLEWVDFPDHHEIAEELLDASGGIELKIKLSGKMAPFGKKYSFSHATATVDILKRWGEEIRAGTMVVKP